MTVEPDYECEFCSCEHPDFHYCIDCGDEISKATCYRFEGMCSDCYGINGI